MTTKIDLLAESEGDRVTIIANVGDLAEKLIHVIRKEDETEEQAAARAVRDLFDWSDFAECGEVDDLRDEFNHHTHGQPGS